MDLSIIIPTKLAHDHITDCVKGLKKTIKNETDFEIIFIVNKDEINNENEREKIKSLREKKIKIISPEKDLGIAGAINAGLDEAKGNYVFITNDDIKIKTRGWFQKYKNIFNYYPNIGTIGFQGSELDENNEMFNLIKPLFPENVQAPKDAKIVYYNHTCATFSSRDRFFEVGTYDEKFWPWGCEDIDFGVRMMAKGYNNIRIPIKFKHYGDKKGVSKRGGATHNLIKERDKEFGHYKSIQTLKSNLEKYNQQITTSE